MQAGYDDGSKGTLRFLLSNRGLRVAGSVNAMTVPAEIHTGRLFLRSWQPADAARLLPILEANVDHLGSWIPAHVAAPAPFTFAEITESRPASMWALPQ